jgi:antitoxin component YwqK of YwqJK toxin-antitoxin module
MSRFKVANPLHAALIGLVCLLPGAGAWAVQDCELNGEPVNTANGNTTAGKTGLIRCKDRDTGLMMREEALQNGKFMGLVRQFEDGKLKSEYSVNERGNRHGRTREFDPSGQVLSDGNSDNGNSVGLLRVFFPNGKLRSVTFYAQPGGEQAHAEFNDRGQLSRLRCGDKPLLAPAADDARWCGFSGNGSQVEFFSSRGLLTARSSYLGGKRLRHETLNDNGQPSYLDERVGNIRTERYYSPTGVKRREVQSAVDGKTTVKEREQDFAESGALARERRWKGGWPVSDLSFFLNGQPRSKIEYGGNAGANAGGAPAWRQTTEYHDNGKVASTGRYGSGERQQNLPTGTHQRFDESGQLIAESVYDERGRITREKAWDGDGKLLRDDEVFEDGSRKAFAK